MYNILSNVNTDIRLTVFSPLKTMHFNFQQNAYAYPLFGVLEQFNR